MEREPWTCSSRLDSESESLGCRGTRIALIDSVPLVARTLSNGIWLRPPREGHLLRFWKVRLVVLFPRASKVSDPCSSSASRHFRQLHLPEPQDPLICLPRVDCGGWREACPARSSGCQLRYDQPQQSHSHLLGQHDIRQAHCRRPRVSTFTLQSRNSAKLTCDCILSELPSDLRSPSCPLITFLLCYPARHPRPSRQISCPRCSPSHTPPLSGHRDWDNLFPQQMQELGQSACGGRRRVSFGPSLVRASKSRGRPYWAPDFDIMKLAIN